MTTSGLARIVAEERARVAAGETGCGFTCPEHPAWTCVRAVHPDGPDNHTPHVGDLPDDGGLAQWVGPCPEAHAAT